MAAGAGRARRPHRRRSDRPRAAPVRTDGDGGAHSRARAASGLDAFRDRAARVALAARVRGAFRRRAHRRLGWIGHRRAGRGRCERFSVAPIDRVERHRAHVAAAARGARCARRLRSWRERRGTSGDTPKSTRRAVSARRLRWSGCRRGARDGIPASAIFWPVAAFAGAAVAVALAASIAARMQLARSDVRVLLMAGVVVGAFANAVIMIVLANAPPDTVRGALWWMMGSLANANCGDGRWLARTSFAGMAFLVVACARSGRAHARRRDGGLGRRLGRARDARRIPRQRARRMPRPSRRRVSSGFVGLVVPNIVRAMGISRQRDVLRHARSQAPRSSSLADVVGRTLMRPDRAPARRSDRRARRSVLSHPARRIR